MGNEAGDEDPPQTPPVGPSLPAFPHVVPGLVHRQELTTLTGQLSGAGIGLLLSSMASDSSGSLEGVLHILNSKQKYL